MDIFQTTITSLGLLYSFLDSWADFSTDAKSLSISLRRDTRILSQLKEYLHSRATNGSHQSKADEDLLIDIADHLELLGGRARLIESRLNPTASFWRKAPRQVTWFHYGPKVKDLQRELHEWVESFDLRLLTVPPHLRSVISEETTPTSNVMATQELIRQVLSRSSQFTEGNTSEMIQPSLANRISQLSMTNDRLRTLALLDDAQWVYIERRPFHPALLQPGNEIKRAQSLANNDRLASILNASQSTSMGLPKCLGLYEQIIIGSPGPSFQFVLEMPFKPTSSQPQTLRDCLGHVTVSKSPKADREERRALHSLSERFAFARRLATLVLLVHSSGWVHESISPVNILVVQSHDTPTEKIFPYGLGLPMLVGFHLSRPMVGDSAPQETKPATNPGTLYQHPQRLRSITTKVPFRLAFDVYSLGVVLLELGLWRSMFSVFQNFTFDERRDAMIKTIPALSVVVGDVYANVVKWCLERENDEISQPHHFVRAVLEPLESVASSV